MAILESWSDGYVLDLDPRREDPLFYYRLGYDWAHAVGFEVLPLYEERTAEEVEISVFCRHRQRERGLSAEVRAAMYARVVPALAAYHDRWRRILLRGEDLETVLSNGAALRELWRLGFTSEQFDTNSLLFVHFSTPTPGETSPGG
jgi:hypothetical protein